MSEIRLEGVGKRFADFVAVEPLDLTIPDRSFFVLLGPSGCGKTTTLRMIAGLELPSSGRILIDGEDVTGLRPGPRDIAFVFQLFALYPHMNVRHNILYPLRSRGVPRREAARRVEEVARMLRIEHLLGSRIGRLSVGDRQRVALARAIVRRPRAFLMDEPLGTLDAELRELMCEELRSLHDRIGATTVYVTHDQIEAMRMADIIAVMNRGRIEQLGPPHELYHRPRSTFVAGFVGSPAMNLLAGRLEQRDGHTAVTLAGVPVGWLPGKVRPGEVLIGVRPEHVGLGENAALRGEVVAVEYLGARQVVTLEGPFGMLKIRAPNRMRLAFGDRLGVVPDPAALVLFDPATTRALDVVPAEEPAHG
jgi:multiple sugar transport system ATP-binding protein